MNEILKMQFKYSHIFCKIYICHLFLPLENFFQGRQNFCYLKQIHMTLPFLANINYNKNIVLVIHSLITKHGAKHRQKYFSKKKKNASLNLPFISSLLEIFIFSNSKRFFSPDLLIAEIIFYFKIYFN